MNHRLPDMFAGLTLATAVALAPVVFADTSEPPPVVAPATTTVAPATTTTTVAPTTTLPPTTTTTIPAGDWQCPEWIGLAIDVGWPVDELPTLDRVIFRESTCHPDSWNRDDPNGGSRGLTQVNGVWLDWFLPGAGIADTPEQLFDPATNLRAALAIWQHSGWRPWGLK